MKIYEKVIKMAIQEYKQKISLVPNFGLDLELSEEFINGNLDKLPSDRRVLARRQIDSLKERMKHHTRLREVYIQEICNLIQFELKKSVKKDLGE